jgi:cytochrome P450
MPLDDPRPLAWAEAPNGVGMWVVSDYRLARQVLADRRFGRVAAAQPDAPKVGVSNPAPDSIINVDGAEHARLRRLVAGAFTERRIADLQPFIEGLAADLLDKMAGRGAPADLISGLAAPLPLEVLCHLVGIPLADREIFHPLVGVLFDLTGDIGANRARTRGLTRYMADLVGQKRREPADDLLSALIKVRDHEDRLSDRELVHLCLSLLMAGYETTTDQIALSVLSMLHDPALADDLRADPARVPAAVEDLLRLSSAAYMTFPRMTTETVRLEGATIEPGQPVVVFLLAVNRATPDASPHTAFGHGIHRCVGAPLARLQLVTVIPALLRRFPALALAADPDELSWKSGLAVRGLKELRVSW